MDKSIVSPFLTHGVHVCRGFDAIQLRDMWSGAGHGWVAWVYWRL